MSDKFGALEREENIIADLPKAYGKPQAFRFYKGGVYTDDEGKKQQAPDIAPVERDVLISAIKNAIIPYGEGAAFTPHSLRRVV